MTPLKTLLSIISLFLVLGFIALIYPENGFTIAEHTFRFPQLTEIFVKGGTAGTADSNAVDPEAAIKEMMEATRQKEFAAYSDSLKFYEDFFESGRTRFDLPNNDPTWFDRLFLHLELAKLDSSVVHIIHYGDSQLEEDRISATIREDLQEEFGGAGPGMLPPVMTVPSMNTSHSNSGKLERFVLFGTKELEATHSRYGPLAQFAKLEGEASIVIQKRKKGRKDPFTHVGGYNTVKLLVNKNARLKTKLNVNQTIVEVVGQNDDGTPREKRSTKVVEAPAPKIETFNKLAVYTWRLPDTTSLAKLYISGNAEVYAISAENNGGVNVDNVAMRGSSGTIFHRMDNELLAEAYKAMNARLIIMEYGGNMVPGMNSGSVEWMKKIITRQIQAVQKANPDADILFIGPADMAKQIDGKWQTYPGLAITIKTLRQIALDNGVAYWDMHRVMGGNGAMIKWVNKEPSLGFTDHIHFTRRGAAYMGDLFCNALRMHYDYFKFRDRHNINDQKLKDIRKYSKKKKKKDSGKAKTVKSKTVEKKGAKK